MFRNKEKGKERGARPVRSGGDNLETIIGEGTTLEGDLKVKGGVRIDGRLKGNLTSDGSLIIGRSGEVEGVVRALDVVVGGRIKGNLDARGKAELQGSARIEGDLVCKTLLIHEGATLDGNCRMKGSEPPIGGAAGG